MGIKERRANNEDKVSLIRGRGRGGGRGRGRGRGAPRSGVEKSDQNSVQESRVGDTPRGRGGTRGRGGSRGRGGARGRGGSRGRGDTSGRSKGRGGGRYFNRNRELDEPEVKEEPEEEKKEAPMPQWKLKKMAEEEERKKPVIEKSFRVILEGLTKELTSFQEIKALTDGEKITPNKTFLEDQVILEYRQKKHALKACHTLCGFQYKDCKLHAALETKNDLKAHRRTRIIIRNLPWSCDEDKLKTVMREFGHVTEVKIPKKDDGRMRGFGFVQFTHGHESAKAIQKVKEINGRKVACDWSLPREVYQEIKDKEEPEEPVSEEENESEEENVEKTEDTVETDEEMEVDNVSEDSEEELSEEELESELETKPEVKSKTGKPDPKQKNKNQKNQQKEKDPTGQDVYEGRSVFLRNIPFDATEQEIEQICGPFGGVKKVNIVRNPAGISKGLAFVEFATKTEADNCVMNSKELSLNDRPVFARISLPQTEINKMKKEKEDELKAKPDKRNLTLAREGEIRAGSQAAKGMSDEDIKRRENFAKLKMDKLKLLDNFIDPCKLMIHNIPKAFTEDEMKMVCQKAANGNVYNDVKKNKIKIKTFHLMKDKDDKSKSLGYAFCTFDNHEMALKCLRVLNNHPSLFSKEKRPIVEFAVENAKAIKLLADRRERSLKKKELQASLTEDQVKAVPEKKKKLRPWQEAKLERKRKRRLEQRVGDQVKMEVNEDNPRVPDPNPSKGPGPMAKKVRNNNMEEKADYAGLEVKRGTTGRLQRPRHSGAKIRARDKGKLIRERQIVKMAQRKKRLATLGVTAVQKKISKVKTKDNNGRKENDSGDFDKLVAAYKQKISAKL